MTRPGRSQPVMCVLRKEHRYFQFSLRSPSLCFYSMQRLTHGVSSTLCTVFGAMKSRSLEIRNNHFLEEGIISDNHNHFFNSTICYLPMQHVSATWASVRYHRKNKTKKINFWYINNTCIQKGISFLHIRFMFDIVMNFLNLLKPSGNFTYRQV
jgi:hypothetical protein